MHSGLEELNKGKFPFPFCCVPSAVSDTVLGLHVLKNSQLNLIKWT